MLAAIRDALDDLGFTALATAVQKLIEREDINSDLRFVLDSETPYPFLQEHVQKFGEKEKVKELGPEQEAIGAAYNFLRQKIDSTLTSVDTDTTIAEEKKKEQKRAKLTNIRDRVLRLQPIFGRTRSGRRRVFDF